MSRLIDADALRQVLEVFTEKDTLGHTPLQLCDAMPTASPWHRVEEPPRDGQECIVAYSGPTDWIYEHATYHSDLNKALEEDIFIEGTDGFIVDGDVGYARHSFNYWMPIEPPGEDA